MHLESKTLFSAANVLFGLVLMRHHPDCEPRVSERGYYTFLDFNRLVCTEYCIFSADNVQSGLMRNHPDCETRWSVNRLVSLLTLNFFYFNTASTMFSPPIPQLASTSVIPSNAAAPIPTTLELTDPELLIAKKYLTLYSDEDNDERYQLLKTKILPQMYTLNKHLTANAWKDRKSVSTE